MKFTTKQINELITGIQLAAELPAADTDYRRFITIIGGTKDKTINSGKLNTTVFCVRDYEVKRIVIEDDLDDSDSDYRNKTEIMVVGIEELHNYLIYRITDFSAFVPIWESDATL